MGKQKIVIIGGVACGPKAASRIKRLDPEAEVTILEKGELISYAGCGLPFYLSGQISDYHDLINTPTGAIRDPAFFKAVKDVTVLNKTIAEKVDRRQKIVMARQLETDEILKFPYDNLVMAVGATPFVPPMEGVSLKGVYSLTTIDDARQIRDNQGPLKGKKAVIIGGGLIGIEAAEAFARQGMTITIIEKLETVLAALIDPEIAYHVQNELQNQGIRLMLGDGVTRINGDSNGKVTGVTTQNDELEADFVLVAIGSRPNVSLAREMGLELGVTGAIKVDSRLQTSDPAIYAGGDCVENINLVTNKPIYTPMGSTANKHGRVIADNICGINSIFKGVAGTGICKVFDINVARTGLSEVAARREGYDIITVLTPSPDKPHFQSDAKLIIIKLIVDKPTRKLLGAQVVGPGDVAKRIDAAVLTISHGLAVDEMSNADLAYAPPFSPAMDNIIVAANIAQNKLNGIGGFITPGEVKAKMDNKEDFILLDLRSPEEYKQMRIEDSRIRLIPLGKLREKTAELPRDKEIICFCKISLRGYEAERILKAEGFENVKIMDGGIICWPYDKFVQ